MPQCETSKECGAAWVADSTPLDRARAVKLRLRAASKKAAEARKEWTGLRAMSDEEWRVGRVYNATVEMWNAERDLADVAEEHISAAMQRIEEEIEPLLRKAQAAIRRAEKGKGSVRQDALEDADDALVDILKILPRQIGDES